MASLKMTDAEHDSVRSWVDTYLNPCALTQELRDEAARSIENPLPLLAFLPGTGLQSGALAYAYSDVGFPIIVGSRSHEKAATYAAELADRTGNVGVEGSDLVNAAKRADIVFWLVPTTTVSRSQHASRFVRMHSRRLAGASVAGQYSSPEGTGATFARQGMMIDGCMYTIRASIWST
jgi:NADP oxidoreductase coenzyme F420-dependent